jgi:hypothetical protein
MVCQLRNREEKWASLARRNGALTHLYYSVRGAARRRYPETHRSRYGVRLADLDEAGGKEAQAIRAGRGELIDTLPKCPCDSPAMVTVIGAFRHEGRPAARGATRRLACAAELRRRGPLTCWAGQIRGCASTGVFAGRWGPNPAIATNASGR